MSAIRNHDEIKRFLQQVCRPIKAREVHREIRLELENHLQELVDEELAKGAEVDEAVRTAIKKMGDPAVIGEQLHKAHRPMMDWGLIALTAVFIMIGLLGVYAARFSLPDWYGDYFQMKQVLFVSAGAGLMLLICFANYRKLTAYSWPLYGITIMMLAYVNLFGNTVNGASSFIRFGFASFNAGAVSPYLLLVSLAGIWAADRGAGEGTSLLRTLWKYVGAILLPGALILSIPSIADFLLFFFGCMIILIVLRKLYVVLAHCMLFAAGFIVLAVNSPYRMQRLLAFVDPTDDPYGMNYMTVQSMKAIQSAGWWGHGYGSLLKSLPELHAEMMYPFLIYCFGWAAGVAIFVGAVMFIVRAARISFIVGDRYGKALAAGLLSVFAIQYLWNMLMSLGWAPMTSFQLPFISYSGTVVVVQLAAMGLMLSVYRRKDLVPRV